MRDAGEQGRSVLSLQTQQLPAIAHPLQANRRLNNSCSNIQPSGRRQRPRRVCLSDEQHHQHQLDNCRRRRQSGHAPTTTPRPPPPPPPAPPTTRRARTAARRTGKAKDSWRTKRLGVISRCVKARHP